MSYGFQRFLHREATEFFVRATSPTIFLAFFSEFVCVCVCVRERENHYSAASWGSLDGRPENGQDFFIYSFYFTLRHTV